MVQTEYFRSSVWFLDYGRFGRGFGCFKLFFFFTVCSGLAAVDARTATVGRIEPPKP